MASISNLGVGSGLDLNSLLDQLTTAEQAPLTAIQKRATSYQAKLSAYGQLQSMLSALQGSAKKLADPAFFNSSTATSSVANVLTAVAGTNAVSGSYAINVTSLAQSQSLVSAGQAKLTDPIGTGTIHIDFGTISNGTPDANGKYSGATFTANPPPASGTSGFDIKIDSSNNTLQGVRDAINKANGGVTASIVNDGSGTPYRLVLTSNATGASNSMRISVAQDDGGTKLSDLLSYSPGKNPDTSGNEIQKLQQTVVAQNAQLTVNNIPVQSNSNTVTDAIQGVTLSLTQQGVSTTVTVQRDTKTIQTAIQGFVTAYNNLQKTAASLSSYDKSSNTSSPLTGDSTLRLMQGQLRGILNTSATSKTTNLASIGVSFQVDGSMALDTDKLTAALNKDPNGVAALFSNTNGKDGYGNQISALVDTLTGTKGTLTSATAGITQTLKSLSDQYTETQTRVNATVDQYRKQFTALDAMMSSMNNTSKYLTQQFNALNNSNSK